MLINLIVSYVRSFQKSKNLQKIIMQIEKYEITNQFQKMEKTQRQNRWKVRQLQQAIEKYKQCIMILNPIQNNYYDYMEEQQFQQPDYLLMNPAKNINHTFNENNNLKSSNTLNQIKKEKLQASQNSIKTQRWEKSNKGEESLQTPKMPQNHNFMKPSKSKSNIFEIIKSNQLKKNNNDLLSPKISLLDPESNSRSCRFYTKSNQLLLDGILHKQLSRELDRDLLDSKISAYEQ